MGRQTVRHGARHATQATGLRGGDRRARAAGVCAAAVVVVAVLAAVPAPAMAQRLSDALISAYRTNPRLDAERARMRAADEEIPRAKSGHRPTVQGFADYGWRQTTTKPASTSAGETQPHTYGLSVSQPIFNGFRTENAVREAEATVRAARQNLRLVETTTLLDAVTAYADVVRDTALVRLNENSVSVLARELAAAEARRQVREITRTDVAQARARKARAVSALDTAKADLKSSRAVFTRVIGIAPGQLSQPALDLMLVPRTIQEALTIADRESPSIIAALYREQGARYSVDKVRGELMPDVRIEAGISRGYDSSTTIGEETSASVIGRLRVPLYQGGEVHARVRQAKHTHVSRLQEIEQARSEVESNVTSAWSRLKAARARLKSDESQVEANRVALEGVRAEEKVGQRTLLDVLNAEQELLDAETTFARTRRDATVAAYTLIAVIGRLDAASLGLATDVYDPDIHHHQVRNKWFGTTITYASGRSEAVGRTFDGDGGASDAGDARPSRTLRRRLSEIDALPPVTPAARLAKPPPATSRDIDRDTEHEDELDRARASDEPLPPLAAPIDPTVDISRPFPGRAIRTGALASAPAVAARRPRGSRPDGNTARWTAGAETSVRAPAASGLLRRETYR